MEKLKELINKLENIYSIFGVTNKEKELLYNEIDKQSKFENMFELREQVDVSIDELEEWKHMLWKIVKQINSEWKILISDFDYFKDICDNHKYLYRKNRVIDSYDYTEEFWTPLDEIVNSAIINSILSDYSETLYNLEQIISLWKTNEDNTFYYLDISNKEEKENIEWISFNENNWDIFKNWEKIWNISPSLQEYKFFKYLYENKWKLKTYEDIFKEFKEWKTEKTESEYLRDIKNRIKQKEVKSLIKNTPKIGYSIP